MKKKIIQFTGIIMCGICLSLSTATGVAFANEKITATVQDNGSIYPSSNLKIDLGENVIDEMVTAGVIAENPQNVTKSPDVSDKVEIKKVQTFGENFVVVTLNARLDKVSENDIILKNYSNNWYELEPSISNLQYLTIDYTLNENGETVFIYKLRKKVKDGKVIAPKTGINFKNLAEAVNKADNYVSWQNNDGGWDKSVDKQAVERWNGTDHKNKFSGWSGLNGEELGTIDNSSTYTQMRHIAAVYRETKNEKYKKSVEKGLEFIFKLQYPSGGLSQVYPKRGNYSDYVTFNDGAMINTLIMLEDMEKGNYPFDSNIISNEYKKKIAVCLDKATDYILKAQIKSQGKLTAWCAQHDPVTYEPRVGRAYELPSISGAESVAIVKFLMNRDEQTPEIKNAVDSAINWFKESAVKGYDFVKKDPNGIYFVPNENADPIWYRFYEVDTNLPIFSGRDGIVRHDIKEVEKERRDGYSWAGRWPAKLLKVYDEYGNYANKIQAYVNDNSSKTLRGKRLVKGQFTDATTAMNTQE